MEKMKIVVVVENGTVMGVFTPLGAKVEIHIADYDDKEAGEERWFRNMGALTHVDLKDEYPEAHEKAFGM